MPSHLLRPTQRCTITWVYPKRKCFHPFSPPHQSNVQSRKKKKVFLALDTFHSIAEQFGNIFSWNKKINKYRRQIRICATQSFCSTCTFIYSKILIHGYSAKLLSAWKYPIPTQTQKPRCSLKPSRCNTYKTTPRKPTAPSCKGIIRWRTNLEI